MLDKYDLVIVQEAKKRLENYIKDNGPSDSLSKVNSIIDFLLRDYEKQVQHQSQCPYCHEVYRIHKPYTSLVLDLEHRTITAEGDEEAELFDVKYCPMCQRPLS